jgi:hypothetical protein
MIFDMRTYTLRPGMMKKHLALYEEFGFVPQTRHLGQPLLHAFTEVGDVNSYVHIWAYKDVADRAARRAAMWDDPEWVNYTQKSADLGALIKQVNQILVAAPFYKMPGS